MTILPDAAGNNARFDDLLDLIGVEHREHDRIAAARNVGKRSGAAAELHQPRVFRRIDVEADDGKSGGDQPARINLAHQA